MKRIHMIDIDDNMVPWFAPADEICRQALFDKHRIVAPVATQWSMWVDYGITQDEWHEIIFEHVMTEAVYAHQTPYDGAAEALRRLAWEGDEIHLVTARATGWWPKADEIKEWTAAWQEEFAVPGILHFRRDKDMVAKELGATHAIDDGGHNFQVLDPIVPNTYLLNQPHNKDVPCPESRRVNSVAEYAAIILKETA